MNSFKKNYPGDITDVDMELYILPHLSKFKNYLYEFVIPDLCAFWIASGYRSSALFEDDLEAHINDILTMFCDEYPLSDSLKKSVIHILEVKHNLYVKSECPLKF